MAEFVKVDVLRASGRTANRDRSTSSGRGRWNICYFLLLLVVGTSVFAAPRRKEQRVELVVKHYEGVVEEHQRGQKIGSDPLEQQMTYFLREDEKLDISVADPNPLLFTYKTDPGAPTPNASYAAAESYAQTLKSVVDFLRGQAGLQRGREFTGAERALHDAGFTETFFEGFVENVVDLQSYLDGAKALVNKSGQSFAEAAAVKTEVAAWATTLNNLEKELALIDRADVALLTYYRSGSARREADRKRAEEEIKKAEAKAAQEAAATAEAVKAKLKPNARNAVEAAEKQVAAEAAARPKSGSAITVQAASPGGGLNETGSSGAALPQVEIADEPTVGRPAANAVEDLLHAFNFAARRAAAVRTGITTAREFMAVTSRIGVPIRFESVPFSFKEDQHPFLTITKVAANADAATASNLKEGKFTFNVEPGGTMEYSVEPALLYSLVEKDDWGTEALPDGTHKITRQSSRNVNGLSLGAMLSMTPRRWRSLDFAPSFQLGLSPVSDRFGIFAGPSFRIFDLFTIGGGIAYQQAERLDDSQVEGGIIPSAADLKIDVKPDTGFYFTISVDVTR
ncbi:MAG TPA: hypothetical protein VNA04_00455 [Thermoanaerobaculia bacterium]|nr:hypothetical protein [Thermoanaerobaculia bacterium]